MSSSPIGPELFKFLRQLKRNNNREWFAENKQRYQQQVLDPAVELVRQIEPPLRRTAPMLIAVAKRHGGSIMRVYKDTRFSKDKTPYKTNVGISLRHQAAGDIHAPGAYVHLEPGGCFIGVGCWRPDRATLASIRAAIDEDPAVWKRARDQKRLHEHFEFAGDQLKTAPRNYPRDHPMIEDLRRIDYIAVAPISEEQIVAAGVAALIVDRIKAGKSLMRFLCDAIGVPY